MRQAGGLIAADDALDERARGWVDFGVDETWELVRSRRRPATPARGNADTRPRIAEPTLGRATRSVAPAPAPREFVPLRSPRSLPELAEAPTASRTPAPVAAPAEATRARADGTHARVDATRARAEATRARVDGTHARADATSSLHGVAPRRTVTIRGRGAERELAFPSDRPARRPATRRHERPGFKPDRMAMWAVVLGIVLLLVAVTSSHAAVLAHVVH